MSDRNAREYSVIEVREYDPAWPAAYAQAARDIEQHLPPGSVHLQHIGSTAVPGLGAKPVIDMLAALRHGLENVSEVIAPLALAGFEYVDKGRPDRHFFRRGPWGHGTHHLHIVAFEGSDWLNQLLFRDWLRAHPADAVAYAALKRDLATTHVRDRPGYKHAKTDFIRSVIARAAVAPEIHPHAP